jgi:hypothetical protein
MTPERYVFSFGWLAVLGVAFLASSALLRRERPGFAPPAEADDLLARIYA